MQLPIERCREFFAAAALPAPLDEAADLLLGELRTRLKFLCDVGLGYLTLDRQSRTLSGGEVQRINLTTALGTSLVNTLFVLDEPSIGLHPRDMQRVIGVMKRLRDAGNTLLVVEHDPQIMLEADRIIDLGPGAGEHGGAHRLLRHAGARSWRIRDSATGAWLAGRRSLPPLRASAARRRRRDAAAVDPPVRRQRAQPQAHRRRDSAASAGVPDRRVRLGQIDAGAGRAVSGAAEGARQADRSTRALRAARGRRADRGGGADRSDADRPHHALQSGQLRRRVRRDPRALRRRARRRKLRRYTAGTFSFNSGNGRCPACGGNGFEHIEMQFLSDVYLRCGECNGTRYRAETLQIRIQGADGRRANIAEVLAMTATEALRFFADRRRDLRAAAAAGGCRPRLRAARPAGADALGRRSAAPEARRPPGGGRARAAASAGSERHRRPAARQRRGKLLIFDEPTTGLHFEDIARLVHAFGLLLEAGHSLLVIEHNLDVIRAADWIIDLGPEGGERGGELVAAGTPAS